MFKAVKDSEPITKLFGIPLSRRRVFLFGAVCLLYSPVARFASGLRGDEWVYKTLDGWITPESIFFFLILGICAFSIKKNAPK